MKAVVFCALALFSMQLGAAQLYRWVDEQGRIEWRDTPPPPNARKVEQRNMSGNTIETSTLPYSLQQAIKNFPVTLWTFDCGDPCTKARAHLARRGIPYSQHDAQKERDALKKLSGSLEAPLLVVGSKQVRGYLEGEWDAALDAAGYPRSPPPGIKISAGKSAPEAARKPPAEAPKAPEPVAPR